MSEPLTRRADLHRTMALTDDETALRPKQQHQEDHNMKHRWLFIVLGAAAFASMAPAQNMEPAGRSGNQTVVSDTKDSSSPRLVNSDSRYRLRPGDSFDVDFDLSPEFNQTVSVQPDGYGSFKGVGSIPVQGKTVAELTDAIRKAYAHILHDPVVVVTPKDFEKPYFVAAGEVTRPGQYDLRSNLTILEALAVAGGPSANAKISKIVLYRRTNGGFQGKVFNLKKLLASRNLSEDPELKPGDLLYVPQSISSRFRPFLPTASMGAFYPVMY